jgi:hypothetical protein
MLKHLFLLSLVFTLSACESGDPFDEFASFEADGSFTVELSGSQQVPSINSADQASATVEYQEISSIIKIVLNVENVTAYTDATLNMGAVGEQGVVQFEFPSSSTTTLELFTKVDAPQLDALLNGMLYINVTSGTFPSGAVRGQILSTDIALVSFSLGGKQEVPAVTTSASGDGYATYNTVTKALSLRVNTTGANDAIMAHIHTGRVGNNGPVLLALESSSTGVWQTPADATLEAETFAVLASGGHYVNVHTPANPSGEVRGQILTNVFALLTFGLDGTQEAPSVASDAGGDGYALVNTTDFSLELTVVTRGVDDAVMAHIHTGRIGENGPVLVALVQSVDDVSQWSVPSDTALTAPIYDVLVSGGHYVNVHTPANPGGEIRGQILVDNLVLATFAVAGGQEVPAVTTAATGSGYALVNTTNYALELKVLTSGVADATMAHVHTGRVGTNGPVLVALEQSTVDVNIWSAPADAALTPEIFGVLASGGHYVNVHTPANGGGELRGQILTDNFVLATFSLSGEQEVPALTSIAAGDGYALVNSNDFTVELTVLTQGVADASMAHIHTGRIGSNGGVLVALEQSTEDVNRWSTPAETVLTAEVFAVLASAGHYVNVHTPANTGGELRGQILTTNFALVTFPLSGDQEVPAVVTLADGDGYALINTRNFGLELVANTRGAADATSANIHTGIAGTNGPVLASLERPAGEANIWKTAAGLEINAEILPVLVAGGHYVKVNTIRGQIQ